MNLTEQITTAAGDAASVSLQARGYSDTGRLAAHALAQGDLRTFFFHARAFHVHARVGLASDEQRALAEKAYQTGFAQVVQPLQRPIVHKSWEQALDCLRAPSSHEPCMWSN